jgi:hypothetical protein
MKRLIPWIAAGFCCAGAQAQLVVVGHGGAPALSKDEVADVFLGRNQRFTPLDLDEASPLRADFYRKATGRDVAQVKATWSRLVFTGKGIAPRELPSADAVKKAIAADPRTIGYIERAQVDGSVKVVLALD